MRFYNIVISDPSSGQTLQTFSSQLADGTNDTGALNIEMDIQVAGYATPKGPQQSYLRIWGPALKQVGAQSQLTDKRIQISGGMARGLPLATVQSQQQGLLVSGLIYQAFGNWLGVNMTLDMTLQADTAYSIAAATSNFGTEEQPFIIPNYQPGFPITWNANTSLGDAIRTTLQTAYPGYTINVNVSSKLKINSTERGVYSNLVQLAQWVKDRSQSVVGDQKYPGIDILIRDRTIYVTDGTTAQQPRSINYADMIGQPTWSDGPQIQVTTVMRGDLAVDDYIQLPPSTPMSANPGTPGVGQYLGFQGAYRIIGVRHVGNFRDPSAEAWATVFTAVIDQYTGG